MRIWSPTSRSAKRSSLPLWDLALAVGTPVLALYLRNPDLVVQADPQVLGYYWVFTTGLTLLALWGFKLQDTITRHFSLHETLDIAEAVLFAELTSFVMLFTMTRLDGIPRSTPLIHGLVLGLGLVVARLVVRGLLKDEEAPGYHTYRQRIIVIGANRVAAGFVQLLKTLSPDRQSVIAILDDDVKMFGQTISGVRVLGACSELDALLTEFSVHGVTVDRVVVAGEADLISPAVLHEIDQVCSKHRSELHYLPRMIGLTGRSEARGHDVVAETPRPTLTLSKYLGFKRFFDLVGALALIVLLFPILLTATILVLVDVGRPVLFWQERVGWRGRSFLIYKFRTLAAPFDCDGLPFTKNREPSVIGRLLRATRIDELPQLLNVLLGDMSLIGPRPLLPVDQPADSTVRLSVRPGITGWAQVNGAKLLSVEKKTQLDEWYVRNASIWLDLQIMVSTIATMMKSKTSSAESLADKKQVQTRNITFGRSVAPSVVPPETPQEARPSSTKPPLTARPERL